VARRLQQLGALTHGDRNATSASDALASSNLQTKCAVFWRQLAAGCQLSTMQVLFVTAASAQHSAS
jgi:hypothetical protein